MQFIGVAYIVFLIAACLVYFALPRVARSFWLLVCSYLFYLYNPNNINFVALLLGATLVTYVSALAMEKSRSIALRRVFLAVGVLICASSLLFYKYFNFFSGLVQNFLGVIGIKYHSTALNLALPLGISYFTFAAIGYLVDVYNKKIPAEKNFFYYALFVSFFPCIVTGPIERAQNMLVQYRNPLKFDYNRVSGGVFRILWGFFKKLVIADNLGVIISAIFSNYTNYSGSMLFLASMGFAYQLYSDFSACSDIAIGTASIFGIKVMENFNRPLAATSFTDLWRRWHISLTSWLRDYIYIPLGGNRKGKARMYVNQIIVFVISGLWHGASLNYCIWGVLNGVYMCVGKATAGKRAKLEKYNPLYRIKPVKYAIQNIITFCLFTSCIVFFASAAYGGKLSDALSIYGLIFAKWGGITLNVFLKAGLTANIAVVLFFAILFTEACEKFMKPIHKKIRKLYFFIRWPIYYAMLLTILFFGQFGHNMFIYQNN